MSAIMLTFKNLVLALVITGLIAGFAPQSREGSQDAASQDAQTVTPDGAVQVDAAASGASEAGPDNPDCPCLSEIENAYCDPGACTVGLLAALAQVGNPAPPLPGVVGQGAPVSARFKPELGPPMPTV